MINYSIRKELVMHVQLSNVIRGVDFGLSVFTYLYVPLCQGFSYLSEVGARGLLKLLGKKAFGP